MPVLISCYSSCKIMIPDFLLVRWQYIHKFKISDPLE
nr:MAG TPA: hypothetical protein [Caudoviricetes sp.]